MVAWWTSSSAPGVPEGALLWFAGGAAQADPEQESPLLVASPLTCRRRAGCTDWIGFVSVGLAHARGLHSHSSKGWQRW